MVQVIRRVKPYTRIRRGKKEQVRPHSQRYTYNPNRPSTSRPKKLMRPLSRGDFEKVKDTDFKETSYLKDRLGRFKGRFRTSADDGTTIKTDRLGRIVGRREA